MRMSASLNWEHVTSSHPGSDVRVCKSPNTLKDTALIITRDFTRVLDFCLPPPRARSLASEDTMPGKNLARDS